MRWLTSIAILFTLTTCQKVPDLEPGEVNIFGHQGAGVNGIGTNVPGNSKASIDIAAVEYGLKGIEVDVQLSADSIPFLFHDQDLWERTNENGLVNEYPASKLSGFRYNATLHNNTGGPFHLARLDAMLGIYGTGAYGIHFFLDAKLYFQQSSVQNQEVLARRIIELVNRYDLKYRILVASGSKFFLDQFFQNIPEVRTVYYGANLEEAIYTAQTQGYWGVGFDQSVTSANGVQRTHDAFLQYVSWVGRSKSTNRKLLAKKPDIIITDNIPYMMSLVE